MIPKSVKSENRPVARQLAEAALGQGIVGFTAEVLSQNVGMLKTFSKAATQFRQKDGGVVTIRFELKDLAKPGER
jgi:hypothetical protein